MRPLPWLLGAVVVFSQSAPSEEPRAFPRPSPRPFSWTSWCATARASPSQWISDSTGGLFVRDTNDLTGALRRIASDLRNYYLLGYTPRNDVFDGRFRKIAVKVRRRGVEVRARSGYFAVRSSGPVLTHVAPALALLEAGKRPHDFDAFAAAWPFPAAAGPARVSLVVAVPGRALASLAVPKGQNRLDVTLLARIRDREGKPVDALSQRFVIDPATLRGAQEPTLRLLRDAWLVPGSYTVEAAAYESGSGKALVSGHPLRFGDVVLQPLAGEALPAHGQRPVVFQVTVPASPGARPPSATIGIWQGERRLQQSYVVFGPPDPAGLFRHVSELATSSLEPGRYDLRVALRDEGQERVIGAPFVIVR